MSRLSLRAGDQGFSLPIISMIPDLTSKGDKGGKKAKGLSNSLIPCQLITPTWQREILVTALKDNVMYF